VQLTSHTDYGLRILLTLGSEAPRHLSNAELAERHTISKAHVAKVVQHLVASGFVETLRGRSGGARLARLPEDIRVGDVVRALEPHLQFVECFQPHNSSCVFTGNCALTHTLLRAKAAMMRELDAATLASLLGDMPLLRAIPE
jgi:Rrf2 family nitric oxide-sensitive transcriptional repressor